MTEPIDKDALITSLQEQLSHEREQVAYWICKYHGEENRFQRQNQEFGRLQAEIAQIRKQFGAGCRGDTHYA